MPAQKRKLSDFVAACELAGVSVDREQWPFVIRQNRNPMFVDHPEGAKHVAHEVVVAFGMTCDVEEDYDFVTIYQNQASLLENDIVPTHTARAERKPARKQT